MELLKNKENMRKISTTYIAYILNGMLVLSTGSLLPFLQEYRAIDYAMSGIIVSLHSIGNLVSTFLSGALFQSIGRKKTVLFVNIFYALSYLLILIGNHPIYIALAFFFTGIARGATTNFCNQVVNELAPGKANLLSGLHAMFAIGAFVFPLILLGLTTINPSNWIYGVTFMLAMGIINYIMYVFMPDENKIIDKKESKSSSLTFLKDPLFIISTCTLFFYLCAEQGVIGWMITYFKDTGLLPDSLSQVTASVLWIMILFGRLLTAYLSTKVKKENLLIVMGLGMVVFFTLLLNAKTTPLILIGIMGFGFSMAGVYPTTVSFTGIISQKYPLSWSFILTFATLGSIIMPTIIGKIAQMSGISAGMSSIVFVVILDLIFILILKNYVKKLRKNNQNV